MRGMSIPATRALLDRVLPKPGQGPDDRQRSRGAFRIEVHAETTGGARYCTTIGADLDPGYDGTAVMLGESALSLAGDSGLGPPGADTPMVALGATLPQRLRDRDFMVTTTIGTRSRPPTTRPAAPVRTEGSGWRHDQPRSSDAHSSSPVARDRHCRRPDRSRPSSRPVCSTPRGTGSAHWSWSAIPRADGVVIRLPEFNEAGHYLQDAPVTVVAVASGTVDDRTRHRRTQPRPGRSGRRSRHRICPGAVADRACGPATSRSRPAIQGAPVRPDPWRDPAAGDSGVSPYVAARRSIRTTSEAW